MNQLSFMSVLFPVEVRFLCDTCKRLVWHANGDGYCCCMAPGMAHISAKHRKPLNSVCKFYKAASNEH